MLFLLWVFVSQLLLTAVSITTRVVIKTYQYQLYFKIQRLQIPDELQPDIISLENLLKSKTEIFDKALKKNMCLDEVRKLFQELRILKMKFDELYKQNSIDL